MNISPKRLGSLYMEFAPLYSSDQIHKNAFKHNKKHSTKTPFSRHDRRSLLEKQVFFFSCYKKIFGLIPELLFFFCIHTALYSIILFCVFLWIPFVYFYYEEKDDNVSKCSVRKGLISLTTRHRPWKMYIK